MRKTFVFAITFCLAFAVSAGQARAYDGSFEEGVSITFSPVVAVLCNLEIIHIDGLMCAQMNVISSGVTTSVLLLKEVEAAQPDALEYIAGQYPSPLLESVAFKLQDIAYQATGEEMTFDEVVDDIINNI